MEPKHVLLSQENRRQLILNAVNDDERLSLYCEALLADPYITMLQQAPRLLLPTPRAHRLRPGSSTWG